MAGAVARTLERGGVLLVEAGTGTGKTLAYLVPAILSRQRVLVSTGTKTLQEQIFFKDLPALAAALDVPFTAAYMKGRANYLCLHRLDRLSEGAGPASHNVFLPLIREWATRTEVGDRAELHELPEDLPFWNEVSATAETCLGTECPQYDECFVTRMRQRAASADLVIVNHHLFCADAVVRQNAYGEVIPACAHAVVDEAHQLEDVATQYFGFSVSSHRLEHMARDAARFASSEEAENHNGADEIAGAADQLREDARAFFAELASSLRTGRQLSEERARVSRDSLGAAGESAAGLTGALGRLEANLLEFQNQTRDTQESKGSEANALARRTGEIRDELRLLLRADDPAYVYFVEFRGKGVTLRASPIDVSSVVRQLLLDRMRTAVLTSATLTVDGSFDYIRRRLGVARGETIRLSSEFDFARQAILYLPPEMPDPRSPEFLGAAARQVIAILERTRGRAFVLFTSHAALRAIHAMAEMALDYPILAQGTAPRTQLLNRFRDTPNSVLFATSSFWQGVDVAGESLSCVIVDKLPFASPVDPIVHARIDAIREGGGEPFTDYQVPLAILTLQQGLGRLIRHRQDRGVLAVLDPRMRTKGYGMRFVASLPPAPVVHELQAIERFFSIV